MKHRIIEDIPEDAKVETTRHDIPTFWCPNCKKAVSPKVPDALPNATIGNRLAILTAWLHYANGNSIGQIIDLFNFHMPVKLTSGGLVQMWARLASRWRNALALESLKFFVTMNHRKKRHLFQRQNGRIFHTKCLWKRCKKV